MTNTVGFHLYEVLRGIKFIETENTMVVARGCGERGTGSCFLMRRGFQFCETKRVLEVEEEEVCPTV